MRKIYDISIPIHMDMVVYKDKPEKRPNLSIVRDFNQGARETRLCLDMHTGTHIDAPLHFVPSGQTIDTVDLSRLLRMVRVIDFVSVEGGIISSHFEEKLVKRGEFILLKTKNSFDRSSSFNPDFVYLTGDGARYLADVGIDGVGIDALGIEGSQPAHDTHKTLLENNILIIEGLMLAQVPEGEYMMSALPLPVSGAEAGPARVVLWEP